MGKTMTMLGYIVVEFWELLCEMSPYLLFGFLVAGVLSVLIKPETVEKHLGDKSLWSVIKAALLGAPLPLCSCGVIPVAASLRRHGASRGATASFLLATPQTSVDSIMVTFSLLGPVFAIFRPVAALISAILGGAVVLYIEPTGETEEESRDLQCNEACCTGGSDRGKIYQALHYGFVNLPGDIGKSLLAGLAIAGVIAAMVPDNFLAGNLGEGLAAKLLMMLVGLPVYVCATASVPVAAALIFKGISPGAALVFLMTGPATNAAAFTTVWKIMGKMTAIVYLVTVAVVALIAGTVLDYLYTTQGVSAAPAMGEMLPDSVKIVSSFVLLAVLGAAFFRSVSSQAGTCGTGLDEGGDSNTVLEKATLIVSGMTCGHCVQTVTRTLAEGAGITNVSVDLKSGIAVVDGRELDVPELTNAVRELGYEVEIKEHQIGPEDEEKADNESSLADRKCSGTCCSGES